MAETTGLSLIHPGDEFGGEAHGNVDIVFVHGLQGAATTWVSENEKGPEMLWLYDLLPKSLPAARILTFGYQSDAISLVNSRGSDISAYAESLLESLTAFRAPQQEASLFLSRVVQSIFLIAEEASLIITLFLAHSLGGLVVQKALIAASTGARADFFSIKRSTAAILFFATPSHIDHKGIFNILQYFSGVRKCQGISEDFVCESQFHRNLDDTSAQLRQIQEDFELLRLQQSFKFSIDFFFEELPVANFGMVVDGTSSLNSFSNSVLLHSDHQTICKFTSVGEPKFKRVLATLKRILNPSAECVPNLKEHQQEILRWLATQRPQIANSAASGSGKWLLENEEFRSWLASDRNSVLWIQGNSGAGKSTLASNFIEDFENHTLEDQPAILLHHFFHYDSPDTSARNLLRSLIFQIMSKNLSPLSDLLSLLDQKRNCYHKVEEPRNSWGEWISQAVLTEEFLGTCLEGTAKAHKLYIVIDALDECSSGEISSVMSLLYFLNSITLKNSIKIFITSRPGLMYEEAFSHLPYHRIVLENENQTDLQQFIFFKMLTQFPDFTNQKQISDTLLEGASGTFLWVKLVMHNLRELTHYEENATNRSVSRLPKSLDDVYNAIYEYVLRVESRAALRVLGWVVFARRRFSLRELKVALDVYQRSITLSSQSSRHIAQDQSLSPYQGSIDVLIASCHGLLEVKGPDGIVSLVHLSVREFLISRAASETSQLGYSDARYFNNTHISIAEVCVNYLAFRSLDDKSSVNFDLDNSGFLQYAVVHWVEHARAADRSGISYQPLFKSLHSRSPKLLKFWISQYQKHVNSRNSSKYMLEGWTPLHISAAFGIYNLVQTIKELGEVQSFDTRDACGRTALSLAAENNHISVLQLLLEAGASITTRDNRYGLSPLEWAALQGNVEIVKILMEKAVSWSGTSLLSIAAARGHMSLVKHLLEKGATINSIDQYWGCTALHLAAGYGHTAIAFLLLARGADPNVIDRSKGQTPLYYAIYKGRHETIKILLEHGAKMGEPSKKLSALNDAPQSTSWPDRVGSSILGDLAIRLRTCMQGSEANGQSSSGNCNKGASGSSGNGCKKRSHQDFQNSGPGGSGSGDRPNKQPALESTSSADPTMSDLGLNLACPYFKHDPGRYGSSRACCRPPGYPDIHRLKQHLYKVHLLKICRKCNLICDGEIELQEHYDIPICAAMFQRDYADGFDESQREKLKKRTEKRNHSDKAQYWVAVYRILFPKTDDASMPTPWHEENINRRLYDESCALSRLQDSSLRTELSQHVQSQDAISAILNIINRHQTGSSGTTTIGTIPRRSSQVSERQHPETSQNDLYQQPPLGRNPLGHDNIPMMPFDYSLPDFMMEPSSDSGFYEGYSLNDDFSRGTVTEVAGSMVREHETAINVPILTPGAQADSDDITQTRQVHASSEDPLSSTSLYSIFDLDQSQYFQLQQEPIFNNYQDQNHNTDEESNSA
ncbi:putative ankyrin repeat-containing protein [Botrytis fragariae]|uniref:Putative ankyrin repeat-containing protein n=1 Tax=Botrytis fragariae TaxID=1964551 RepID=A0A8H6EKS9_9HELO|nr:putative ankyrin repeat-containing protein [Botrytis fragariae]KAF5875535.1 putative ankyrin repeat-containing protein [Botrytis fragariae]